MKQRCKISPAIIEQIKTAYAAGIGLREIARNMQIPAGTVLARAKREGWTRQIHAAKQQATPAATALLTTPMQSTAIVIRQRAERHVQRMAGVTEGVLPHLEALEPAAILEGIHQIEKFDRMARRNYGLDEQPITGGAVNVSILTNQAAIQFVGAPA